MHCAPGHGFGTQSGVFWWQFPYCLGSCGHGANSWCFGCPLRRGEIKAGAWYHKGACLVLFNSPKLGHNAKAAPCNGKHSITGTTTAAQQDTASKRDIELWKKSFTCSFTPLSAHRDTDVSKTCIHVISSLWLLLVCRDTVRIHNGSLIISALLIALGGCWNLWWNVNSAVFLRMLVHVYVNLHTLRAMAYQ